MYIVAVSIVAVVTQIHSESVMFTSSHTLLEAGDEAWCSYIAVSECISETLTLLVGSSARWNISLATVSNPVYCEANALPHRLRDTIITITGGALVGPCTLGLAPSSGFLCPAKMCMNVLREPLGNCSSHYSSPAESFVTIITVVWILKWLYLHFKLTPFPHQKSLCTHFNDEVHFDWILTWETARLTYIRRENGSLGFLIQVKELLFKWIGQSKIICP